MGPRLPLVRGVYSSRVFPLLERLMKTQQRRGPEDDGHAGNAALTKKKRPEAKQETIERRKIRRTSPGSVDDQELLLQEHALGNDGTRATRLKEPGDLGQQVSE